MTPRLGPLRRWERAALAHQVQLAVAIVVIAVFSGAAIVLAAIWGAR